MRTTHAIWERENLGVDAWELTLDATDTPEAIRLEEARIRELGAEYVVLKTPVNCPALLFGLPKLGYAYVESVFHVMVKRDEYHMPASIARFDRGLQVPERTTPEEWARVYARIRAGVFATDRVSIDPAFGPKKGGNRYANWLKSMLENGGRLWEVESDGRPVGFFVICRRDADTVDPVLMGLYDERHDRGMGALLHKKTLDTCFTLDCKRLTSTIVSNNHKVLRVYVNAGATFTDMLYTYVKHIGP